MNNIEKFWVGIFIILLSGFITWFFMLPDGPRYYPHDGDDDVFINNALPIPTNHCKIKIIYDNTRKSKTY